MIIENYKGIMEYEEFFVRINTYKGIININGFKLRLEQLTDEAICIKGVIEDISLESISDLEEEV